MEPLSLKEKEEERKDLEGLLLLFDSLVVGSSALFFKDQAPYVLATVPFISTAMYSYVPQTSHLSTVKKLIHFPKATFYSLSGYVVGDILSNS